VAAAVTERPDLSRDLGREALTLAAAIGADGITRRITGRLRAVGIRFGQSAPHPRPSHGWDSLTQTESRIVELLGGGASGADIARTLFVTPRTVQAHISHALAKLGLTNRTELAAAAARRTTT
jgi:DNA-binding CsgD family transcriptional regulator